MLLFFAAGDAARVAAAGLVVFFGACSVTLYIPLGVLRPSFCAACRICMQLPSVEYEFAISTVDPSTLK
jgi:hypothetical protein